MSTQRPDRELDAFLADVTAAVDDELASTQACPDLAAVVELAHRLDPTAVPAHAVEEVAGWAPIVSIGEGRRRRQTRDDPQFAAILEEVRADVEQDVMRRLAPAPAAPAPAPAPAANAGPVRRVWVGVLAAAAVLVVVAGGLLTGVLATRDEARLDPHEAALHDPPPTSEPSQVRREAEGRAAPDRGEALPAVDDTDAALVEPAPAAEEAAIVEPTRTRPRARRRPVDSAPRVEPSPAPTPEPTLEELDAAAHAAWRAGDRAGARDKFRELIRRAGTGRLADLAYGDLFTLARQAKSPRDELALWKEYLGKFPDGRFADDARAGLCRRTSDDAARRTCWEAYLADSPKGAHRGQAKRELGQEGG